MTTQAAPTQRAAQMRAAVIAAPGRAELLHRPIPEPGPGEVRIRLEGSGVCGSNLPSWEGREWFKYPLEAGSPGHEGWGVVELLGDGVTGLRVGDRVATLSGRALAEYCGVPAVETVKLPDALAGQPVPGEPLGCAMNIFRRS